MTSRPTAQPLQSSNTGGSTTGSQFSQFSSAHNPHGDSAADEEVSRNQFHTPQESPTTRPFVAPTTQAEALSSHPPTPTAASMSQPDGTQPSHADDTQPDDTQPSPAGPPLPAKPAEYQSAPPLPPRPSGHSSSTEETHPGFTRPFTDSADADADADADESLPLPRPAGPARSDSFARRDSSTDPTGQPPRRRLTTGDIALTTVPYARQPTRLVAYLLPLPAPKRQGQTLAVPQRYLLYTPPAPHLLPPAPDSGRGSGSGVKEAKRHRAKRFGQEQMRKAKTYEGKTVSFRGLHSKTLRGVDWAIAAIKSADITFFARVPRKKPAIDELVLLHPPQDGGVQQADAVHAEFKAQLARAQRKAARDSVISVALFVPALVIDTLAVIVWPFGGLAEIDGVWAYASISAWLTARNVSKRLDDRWMTTAGDSERRRLGRELHAVEGRSPERSDDEGILRPAAERPPRPDRRSVHFQEELGEESDKEAKVERVNGNKILRVRFVPDEAMETMDKYFREVLHKRNPRAFPSPGVPPTKTDVLASIGWWPDRRGRFPGSQQDGDWDDENWQTRQVKEDLDKVMGKAAKEWDQWCKKYAEHPERAMKEKGHSRTSAVLRRMHLKKGEQGEKTAPSNDEQETPEGPAAESGPASGSPEGKKAKLLGTLRSKKDAVFGGRRGPAVKI